MLDHNAKACLDKNWSVFAMLLGLVRRLVNSPLFTRSGRRRACHLLRMAEAFARRLLVLQAQELTLTARPTPKPRLASGASSTKPAAKRGPARPGLCLAEPLPAFIPLSDMPFPEPERRDPVFLDPAEITDAAPVARRLAVLEDILLRPAHHARRMAVWLPQFTQKTNRSHPFCLGLPPGASHRPKDPDLDRQLRDTNFFARRVLSTAPG